MVLTDTRNLGSSTGIKRAESECKEGEIDNQ